LTCYQPTFVSRKGVIYKTVFAYESESMTSIYTTMKTHLYFAKLCFVGLLVLAPVVTTSAEAQSAAEKAYADANTLILDGKWGEAGTALASFLDKYPDSDRYDDAQFFYCYARDQFSRASEEAYGCYDAFATSFPESQYVDDALNNMVRLASALEKAGNPGYSSRIKALKANDDEEVALAALYALRNIGDDSVLPTILGLLERTESESVRGNIVYILADFEGDEVIGKLVEIASTDKSMDVRKNAVYAIGNNENDKTAVDALATILHSDAPTDVRKASLYALGNQDSPEIVELLKDIALTDASVELAKAATYALGNSETPAASRALKQILTDGTSSDVRKASLYAMSNSDDPSIIPVLEELARTSMDTRPGESRSLCDRKF